MGIYEDLILTGIGLAFLIFFILSASVLDRDKQGISKAPEKVILFILFFLNVLIPIVFAGIVFFFAAYFLFTEYQYFRKFQIMLISKRDFLIFALLIISSFIWFIVPSCIYAWNGYKEFLKRLKKDSW